MYDKILYKHFEKGDILDTLILFSSKYGSTKKSAEYLSEKIKGSVVMNLAENEPNIDCFKNIFIGGAVYNGKLTSNIRNFLFKNEETLKDKNLYIWINCVTRLSFDQSVLKDIPASLKTSAKKIVFASGIVPETVSLYDRIRFISVQKRIAGLPAFKIDFDALDSLTEIPETDSEVAKDAVDS